MEFSNFYELQQQQLGGFSSSSSAAQSTTELPPIHQWNPTLPLNNNEYDHYMNEILPMSAQLMTKEHIDFGQLGCDDDEHESCPNPCSNSLLHNAAVDLNQNLWHTTSSLDAQLCWISPAASSSTNIDYVLDSVITSSSNSMPNLATDFITNCFNNGDNSSQQNLSFSCHGRIHHHDSSYSESSTSNKNKAFSRTKRVCSSSQNDAAPKKQRAASQSSSCPLPKVVKEKIGDRIAALHRLVAPFGKTDAASVLTEAIGYIQFLHHQIQTLSMSCTKPFQSNRIRCFQQVSGKQKGKECWDGKQGDLKSRGLSLVPISVAAYVSSSTTVGID